METSQKTTSDRFRAFVPTCPSMTGAFALPEAKEF
jgi:hypothetical protein